MLRSRSLALALALSVVATTPARTSRAQPAAPGLTPHAPPSAAEVKRHMDEGDRAAKAKDWEKAATEYRAAFEGGHSAAALIGLANALYEAKRPAEAFEAYDDLLRSFGDTIPRHQKALAETRLKALAAQTGALAVRVNDSGAEVTIDDKPAGTSPVPEKRVSTGAHKVRVTRPGFAPFEQTTNVGPGATETVSVTLAREAKKGRLGVKEKDNRPIRVVVDGLDVGAAPWEGEVDPGAHEVLVRSTQASSPPQRVEVEAGKTATVELAAVTSASHLEVTASEPHAILFLDGHPLGEGTFKGDVSPGEHMLVASSEGFERFERRLNLAPQATEVVEVKLQKPGAGAQVGLAEAPSASGFYGGFGLLGIMLPNGTGNDLETSCSNLGASSCDTPTGFGGGLLGYFGYSFDPIGFELLAGGEFDQSHPKAHFPGDNGSGTGNPGLNGLARTEEFSFLRTGGFGALRVRANIDTRKVRVSFAGGVGLGYKYIVLAERKSTTTDGKLSDTYAPSGSSYFSPGVTLDLSVQWRVSRPVALSLGVFTWIESASFTDVRAPGDKNRFMGGGPGTTPAAIDTPPYQLASGAQIFLGPYLGMQFGP